MKELLTELRTKWELAKLQRQILKAWRNSDIDTALRLQARLNAKLDMEQGMICNCEHCNHWKRI